MPIRDWPTKSSLPLRRGFFWPLSRPGLSLTDEKFASSGHRSDREFLVQPADNASTKQEGRHVLIFGGSQGAKAINSAVLEGLPLLSQRLPDLTITHQTGEGDFERVSDGYRSLGIQAKVVAFLYDMPAVLRTADLVVARAGAMTIAELTACGKAAILIPLPTAIYDHQMKNARAMEAAGGAIVLPQADLTGVKLGE